MQELYGMPIGIHLHSPMCLHEISRGEIEAGQSCELKVHMQKVLPCFLSPNPIEPFPFKSPRAEPGLLCFRFSQSVHAEDCVSGETAAVVFGLGLAGALLILKHSNIYIYIYIYIHTHT